MSDKSLIVYYSWSGNTENIARFIQAETGGDLIELKPKESYPASYNQVLDRAKKEIRNNYKPELENTLEKIDSYKVIFVGTPNWWSTIAPPLSSFLSEYNFSGKIIAPFLSHGGGGKGSIFKDIKILCPEAKVIDGLSIRGRNVDKEQLKQWLEDFN